MPTGFYDHWKIKGKAPKSAFKKGHKGYWKGKKLSEEHKRKIGETHKQIGNKPPSPYGRKVSEETKEKIRKSNLKHWDKIGRKQYKRLKHERSKYIQWRTSIFERDDFTCQKCGIKNYKGLGKTVRVEVHHKKSWSKFPRLRFDTNNGITLCKDCHKKTDNYGSKGIRCNEQRTLGRFC